MNTSFDTVLRGFGNNTGIEVPGENIAELGAGKVPPVRVTVSEYVYESTVAVMDGRFMISFSKAHRDESGITAGDAVRATLELLEGPRNVEVPKELQEALEAHNLSERFAGQSYSKRKEFCRQVDEAQAEDTRQRRIAKVFEAIASV